MKFSLMALEKVAINLLLLFRVSQKVHAFYQALSTQQKMDFQKPNIFGLYIRGNLKFDMSFLMFL